MRGLLSGKVNDAGGGKEAHLGDRGNNLFSPDMPVTREQIAVTMTNYAGQIGYSIPAPLSEVPFTDSSRISDWTSKEDTAMQRAGIVGGNRRRL